MQDLENKITTNKFMLFFKGIVLSMGLTLIMILILSIILSFSDIKENVIMPTVIFISSFSILMGGFIVSKKIDEKGIVFGSLLGLIYMFMLYFISSIINFDFSVNVNSVIMIVFGVFGGALGGILGVNFK